MIMRAVPLKDATVVAVTSCGQGTIYDVGAPAAGQKVYAQLHVLSSSTGGIRVRLQNSSSSAGGGMADVFVFTSGPSRTAQWMTPLSTATLSSTFERFWRATWELTTSGESYNFLPSISIR